MANEWITVSDDAVRSLCRLAQLKGDDCRWALHLVCIEFDHQELSLTCGTSRRFVNIRVSHGLPFTGKFAERPHAHERVQVCAKGLLAALGKRGEVALRFAGSGIEVRRADGSIVSVPHVEGRFPPWRDIVPKESANPVAGVFCIRELRECLDMLEATVGADGEVTIRSVVGKISLLESGPARAIITQSEGAFPHIPERRRAKQSAGRANHSEQDATTLQECG